MSFKKIPNSIRQHIAATAKHHCEYCRCPESFATQIFTVEHIKPRQKGGDNTLENLAWACAGCNALKHTKVEGKDPQTAQKVSLFNPRKQSWEEHFAWSDDFTEVVGKTACGRATIEVLRLNKVC